MPQIDFCGAEAAITVHELGALRLWDLTLVGSPYPRVATLPKHMSAVFVHAVNQSG